MVTRRQNENVQQFERRSGTYERSWTQPLFFDRVHRVVLDLVAGVSEGGAPASILDIGCGTGRLLRKAGVRWPAARLIGVDPAEGMVAMARQLTPVATFEVGMAEALPLADASVDVAWSTMSFHHWQDRAAGVREVARVLRPGGHFVLADTVLPPWLSRIIRHFGQIDPDMVRALFAQAELAVQVQRRMSLLWLLVTVGEKSHG